MSRLIAEHLQFTHFVIATAGGNIFASARDANNRVYNFVIDSCGSVMEQVQNHFESLPQHLAEIIALKVSSRRNIPVYRTTELKVN